MKKFITLLIIFLFVHSFCLYADNVDSFDNDPLAIGQKKPFGIQERSFEIGIMNFNLDFANNFLSISEVFQDVINIDIDKLSDGFNLNMGLNVTPFYFSIKTKKGWGFGLSTNMEAIGVLALPGSMLTLSEAVQENSDISGALFASATINTFFNVKKLKININPSLFYTLAYITPPPESTSGLVYTLDYPDGNTVMCIDYSIRLYTGFPLDNTDNFSLTAKPGFDFNVGFEYPLAKEIGLSKILPFLDFDISLNFVHVPLIASKISDYTQIDGRFGSNEPIKLFNGDDNGNGFLSSFDSSNNEPYTGTEEIEVTRPFKIVARLDWRPLFGIKLLTVSPVFGLCYNKLYHDPVSWEWGLNACLNLANFLLVKAGVNYTDRIYINSIGIAINVKAFELDIGGDLRSQTFTDSWTGKGFGVNFGLKFGW